MTRLYLIRHGQTEANTERRYQGSTDTELSTIGLSQAQILADYLSNIPIHAVYSSPLKRAHQTASVIAKTADKEVKIIDKLQERYYGVWENLPVTDIKQKYLDIYNSWLKSPSKTNIPKAETLEQVQKRGIGAIETILKNHNHDENIVAISHGCIMRTILLHYLKMDLENFYRIKQSNCAVNIIDFHDFPIITTLNNFSHIDIKNQVGRMY